MGAFFEYPGVFSAFIGGAFILSVNQAGAVVSISANQTHNLSCSGGVCAPTAKNAVLNVSDLETMLASGNVKVTTGSGALAKQVRDIEVWGAFSWTSASTLTLDAYRSITVNKPISDAGPGALTLTTNDGGSGGLLSFGQKGRISFLGTGNPLTINGNAYTLVSSIAALATDIGNNPSGFYALANNYDATPDGTYRSAPIKTVFTGTLEGFGNVISHLTIRNGQKLGIIGLFREIGTSSSDALVENLGVAQEKVHGITHNIQGGEGGLVGVNSGTLRGDWTSGGVTNTQMNLGDAPNTGGLAGLNWGMIENSYSLATVNANVGSAGGLVGNNQGSITKSHATGHVANTGQYAGGVAGGNEGMVSGSYASGNVSGHSVGGLVAYNGSMITQSFAIGQVTGSTAGGLVAYNVATISNSYSTGAVTGSTVGGLVGVNDSPGLPGGAISASYATGFVTSGGGNQPPGGLIGVDNSAAGKLTNTYWDTTTSGISDLGQGAGNIANDPGITGLTTTQLQSGLPAGFNSSVWAESSTVNGGLPYLITVPPPK